ncbi:MAG: DUF4037 domain-containing protein, partial [Acutalibacteraceae bacterium]
VHLGDKKNWYESWQFYPKHGYVEYTPNYMRKELVAAELWDIYDSNRNKTGKTLERGQPMKKIEFIKGMDLCESFFNDCAKPIIEKHFPNLKYSAGLIGYGSDVLGYDDSVSTDHMWGPRFYLFLGEADISKKNDILNALSENLPYTYKGYSVNFTEPDANDCGVQHPELITEGRVNPLVFIHTFDEYLNEQLGTANFDNISPVQWLTLSEHRLLSLVSGKFFVDSLNCSEKIERIKYYPDEVKLYMIASNWEIIASEQAFVKRCGECGDEIGSQLVCARLAERLMRLCFLYKDTYAPYSKWFGTAFNHLDIDDNIKQTIRAALSANNLTEREDRIVEAQALVANIHNASHLTDYVDYQIESYFGRNIKVIFADKFAEETSKQLINTALENIPLIGTLSQIGGLSELADEKKFQPQIMKLYGESCHGN